MNNKKKVIISFIFLLLLLSIFTIWITSSKDVQVKSIQADLEESLSDESVESTAKSTDIGDYAFISSVQLISRKTGTGPFDEESETNFQNSDGTIKWTAGNDVSEDDNIVRSFDQITWTIENTMSLKSGVTQENFKGGTLEIKATLPEDCKNVVEWDLDSMAWAEDVTVSDDQTTFTAKYSMTETEITVPGKQTLVFVLKVLGAPNGTEITPAFSISLTGNEENEAYELADSTVMVSAAANYNIKLVKNEMQKKATVDYGEGNTAGRMYGYGVILQLYNEDTSKGLKGIEYPDGDINFDINLKLERSLLGSTDLEDITNECTPILWNYKINKDSLYGNIADRSMSWGANSTYMGVAPLGTASNRTYSVYNSGNINMSQNGSTINTTISGYKFDGTFPIYNFYYEGATHTTIEYSENIGCFSVGYFQIFVPDNEASTIEDRNYYLTVENSNFSATSSSGVNTSTQIKTNDDSSTVQHVLYRQGDYSHSMILYNKDCNKILTSTFFSGDGYINKESEFTLRCRFGMSSNNDYDIYGADKFIKFDADATEPVLFSDGSKYKLYKCEESLEFNMYYVTKKDGTNWTSQTDMNNGNIEDMDLYENIEDIPEDKLCVGVFFETKAGYLPASRGDSQAVLVPLKIKDTAIIGQTYGFTQRTRYWLDSLDRNVYSQTILSGYDEYPEIEWDSKNRNYIKTEYDENGNIVAGTHSGGLQYGQTLLIVGGDLSITKTAINESTGEEKINYDFSKNEYNVTYKITPDVSNLANNNTSITGINLKVEDTLPAEMTYAVGTCDYGEPEITENSDGTTTLVWYIYGVTAGEEIEPITYQAHIDELTNNGTILESSVIISEVPDTDSEGNKIYKVGNTEIAYRTYTTSIQVISLSSYSLYKTTETPVIEINGDIHYKITAINKTDDAISDFQLLDILPYNGDGRGTSYNGTYTVDSIEITQTNIATNEIINNSNLNLYITSEESVRTGVTAKDENLGTDGIWTEIGAGYSIKDALTAYAVTGSIEARTRLEVDIYIQTNGNKPYDNYKNSATAQTHKETEVMETSIITVQDVKRSINGKVWLDSNKDGLISDGEEFLSNIKATLVNEDGTTVTDIHGEEISTKLTDENGYYYFEDMPKGNYKVIVGVADEEYEITLKEVGANREINSKFNADGSTDVIETLNSIESPVITESNVNAGITYKDTKVTVHHYIEGTTTKLSEDVTINGKIKDAYTTTIADDIPEYYELVSTPSNATGTMTLDEIEVIYYYKLKKYDYTVNYLEKDTNKVLNSAKTVNGITYGTEIISSDEIIDITGYDYNSVDKESLTIGTTANEINIYYTKGKFDYSIEYYYNGIIDNSKTENLTAIYQDVITEYIDKNKEGYKFEKIENLPLTITENSANNVIKVYYIIDDGNTKTLSYTVEYYKDGVKVENDTQMVTAIVQILQPDTLTVDKTQINTTNKYSGYECEKTEPETIPDIVKNGDIIKIYYVRKDAQVIVKYVDKMSGEEISEEVVKSGKVFDQYDVAEDEKEISGYTLIEKPTPTTGEFTEEEQIKIYYYAKNTQVTVNYIDKNTGENLDSIIQPGKVGDNYTSEAKEFTGYVLIEKPTNESVIMTEEEIILNYYYVRISAGVVEKHIDETTGKLLEKETIYEGNEGDQYKTSSKEFEGYELVEEKLPANAEGVMTKEQIEVIYYYRLKEYAYKVEYYYDGVKNESKTENLTATYGSEIKTYTNKIETGYEFEKTENLPLTVSENVDNNIINVYYVRKNAQVIVKYVDKISGEEISEEVIKTGKVFDQYDVAEDEKEISGYTLIEKPTPITGEFTEEVQTKIYYYAKNAKVTVKYLEKGTNNELSEEDTISGYEGKQYKTEQKDITGYTFVESTQNTEGTMTINEIEVIYYYAKNTKVTVNHIDKNTGENLANIVQAGKVGDSYTSEAKDFTGYILVEKPTNESVIMTAEEIVLNYYYVRISAGVIEKHIDIISNELLDSKLYEGNEGDLYTTTSQEFEGYDLVEEKLPTNAEGIMTKDSIEVKYYYIRKASVIVEYIDKITGEKILEAEEDSTEYIYGHEGDNYKTEEKEFENYVIVKEEYPSNAEGTMEITKDENGKIVTQTEVKYYYVHKSAGVIEKHIDIKTGELIEKETTYKGNEGDPYKTSSKEFEGYDLVEEKLPTNAEGTMTKDSIEVKYYYIRKASVIAEYIDKITGEKLLEIDEETSAQKDSTEVIDGHEGDSYKTEEKEFENYVIVKEDYPTNAEGTMEITKDENGKIITQTEVKYYYVHKSAGVIERHIDEATGELLEEETTYEGNEGDLYKTSSKEFEDYDLVEEKLPANAEGTMAKELIEVNYYYSKKVEEEETPSTPNTPSETTPETPETSETQEKTEVSEIPKTGDVLPVVVISIIILIIIANVVQIVINKKNKK